MKTYLACLCLVLVAGLAQGQAEWKKYPAKTDLPAATIANLQIGDQGDMQLCRDLTQLRLLTSNRGFPSKYNTGATYRYLAPNGEAFTPKGDPDGALLMDGAIAEHALLSIEGRPAFMVEFDLQREYLVETIRLFGFCRGKDLRMKRAVFEVSKDRKTWERVGEFPTPHPVGAYEVFPLAATGIGKNLRYARFNIEAEDNAPVGLTEVEIWCYPYYERSGFLVSAAIDMGDKRLGRISWQEIIDTSRASPLATATARPLSTPTGVKVQGGKQMWDGDLPAAKTYYYSVSALNAAGETLASPVEAGTTWEGKPGNILLLSWNYVPGATAYRIYRGDEKGKETLLFTKTIEYAPFEDFYWTGFIDHGDLNPDLKTHPLKEATALPLRPPQAIKIDRLKSGGNLPPGVYHYRVAALDPSGESEASQVVSGEAQNPEDALHIHWQGTPGATGYKIYRSRNREAFDNSLVKILGDGNGWIDNGFLAPGEKAELDIRCGPTPELCKSAGWARVENDRPPDRKTDRYMQYQIALASVSGESSPIVKELKAEWVKPTAEPVHITQPEREIIGSNKAFVVKEAEECNLKYFINEKNMGCANTLQKGKIAWRVEQAGKFHVGVVYKDDEDGVELLAVALNGNELGRIKADQWPWNWPEHQKDSNFFLWLSPTAIDIKKGDELTVEAVGPSTLCYRVDKILLVPPGVQALPSIR